MVSNLFVKATTAHQNACVGMVLLYVVLSSRLLFAAGPDQQGQPGKRPTAGANIVRIEYGSSSGMCTGYCNSQTTIQPMTARSVSRTNFSLNGYRDTQQPDMKINWKITTEEWERAKAAVDTESLFGLPDRIGCPGCVDEPVDWISVKYSDGTEKSVICNRGGPATDMADKIEAAIARVHRRGPRPIVPLPPSSKLAQ